MVSLGVFYFAFCFDCCLGLSAVELGCRLGYCIGFFWPAETDGPAFSASLSSIAICYTEPLRFMLVSKPLRLCDGRELTLSCFTSAETSKAIKMSTSRPGRSKGYIGRLLLMPLSINRMCRFLRISFGVVNGSLSSSMPYTKLGMEDGSIGCTLLRSSFRPPIRPSIDPKPSNPLTRGLTSL